MKLSTQPCEFNNFKQYIYQDEKYVLMFTIKRVPKQIHTMYKYNSMYITQQSNFPWQIIQLYRQTEVENKDAFTILSLQKKKIEHSHVMLERRGNANKELKKQLAQSKYFFFFYPA